MRAKAKYYVEWVGTVVRDGYADLDSAEREANIDALGGINCVRIRYRGKVIALWRNGTRVK